MKPDTFPLRLLLATFSGWVNREQTEVIDDLREENLILKEQLRGRRLRLTDDQRRRLSSRPSRVRAKNRPPPPPDPG